MPSKVATRLLSKERSQFAGLLVAQLFCISILPFVDDRAGGRTLLQLGVWSIILSGIFAASSNRSTLKIALFVVVPAFLSWLGPDVLWSDAANEASRMLSAALSFTFTTIVVVQAVAMHERVTLDTILGGINAYLLMAFTFMMMHTTVFIYAPEMYRIQDAPLGDYFGEAGEAYSLSTMLYFSFTTLTTLGYGDIVPVGSVSRLVTSAQAVIGQLYVAIFIGRLVGLQVSHARSSSNDS